VFTRCNRRSDRRRNRRRNRSHVCLHEATGRRDYRHNPRRNRSRRSVAPIVGHLFTWRNRRRDRWRDRLLRSIAATIAPCEHLMRVTVGGIRLGFRSALLLAQVLGFFRRLSFPPHSFPAQKSRPKLSRKTAEFADSRRSSRAVGDRRNRAKYDGDAGHRDCELAWVDWTHMHAN